MVQFPPFYWRSQHFHKMPSRARPFLEILVPLRLDEYPDDWEWNVERWDSSVSLSIVDRSVLAISTANGQLALIDLDSELIDGPVLFPFLEQLAARKTAECELQDEFNGMFLLARPTGTQDEVEFRVGTNYDPAVPSSVADSTSLLLVRLRRYDLFKTFRDFFSGWRDYADKLDTIRFS